MTIASFNWRRLAACRKPGVDPAIFMPEKGQQAGPAKAICAVCPAKAACLAEALADPALIGVWGGTSHVERRRMLGITGGFHRHAANVPEMVGVPRPVPAEFFDPKKHRVGKQRLRRQANRLANRSTQ